MADPVWLSINNKTTVTLQSHGRSLEIDSLDAMGEGIQAFLITLYSLTAFLAFTGNSLVILVEVYGKRSAMNLRKFLINLAISDILIGVLSVPFNYTDIMLGRWIFNPFLCPISQFVQILSVFVTTYTLTAIGIERYIVTLHPLSYMNKWLRSHCNLILYISWLFGGVLASVVLIHTKAVQFEYKNETFYDCRNDIGWNEQHFKIYIVVSFLLTFAMPVVFITISYGAIGRRLLSCPFLNSPPGSNFDKRNSEFINKMKVFKMLVAVVILFVICWLPIKLFMLLLAFWPEIVSIESIYSYYAYYGSYFLCHWLSMANSFVNPIIYCFMSKSFRADLFDLIIKVCDKLSTHNSRTTEIKPTS